MVAGSSPAVADRQRSSVGRAPTFLQSLVPALMALSEKGKQLGMPFGTACHRLRKSILFQLLKRLGENSCFRCNAEITSADDLSIDHKIPWLHSDSELFWDLGNIGFSHRKCNKKDRPSGVQQRVKCPDGFSRCHRCKEIKPLSDFNKNSFRWNGVAYSCRDCAKAVGRKRN